jgi:putative resolvase
MLGRCVKTLQRWDREGTLQAHRNPTNRRYYTHDQYLAYRGLAAGQGEKTIVYARVSSAGQKRDSTNQVTALREYCLRQQYQPDEWIEEIGSGLNHRRTRFNRSVEVIELGRVRRLIFAYQDRLVRFGFDWFALFCQRHGTDVIILNGDILSPEQEVVQDFLAMVQVFLRACMGCVPTRD